MTRLLLLSGGIDSTCLAAWLRPEHCLSVDYGQRAAVGERRAAAAVSGLLHLPIDHITVDASAVGAGLMTQNDHETTVRSSSPAAEWWPYRNQLLITLAAGWGVVRDFHELLLGTVAGDGARHADGTQVFYDAASNLLQLQEGGLAVRAPAIGMTTVQLVEASGVHDSVLARTHSCHLADVACGHCPGCLKRSEMLEAAGRLR